MKKMKIALLALLCSSQMALADNNITQQLSSSATATMKQLALDINTDKCSYSPGETIKFTITGNIPANLHVRYRHLGDVVVDEPVASSTFTWTAPEEKDFMGYLAELYVADGTTDVIYGTIAIDVSSDWTHFPRYGFVADYSNTKSVAALRKEMTFLNRFHINGVQFQDWHYAHDSPLPFGDYTQYKDVANRDIYLSTVKRYIEFQHRYGMKSIFYNLCMGALDGYESRYVSKEWFMYKDKNHSVVDMHDLPDTWKSDIYLVNPGNKMWQGHMQSSNKYVYNTLDFDGFQIDQLGYRGELYDYDGNAINLPQGYASFINAMKEQHPQKDLIMNAVSEYGQEEIASTGNVGFFYNEVWGNHDYNSYTDNEATYRNLKDIISRNRGFDASKQTVFAAYMDYLRDNNWFNTAGIVMTDAVMFALGGSHLELGGDHMLCREYFPYAGMKWHDELEDWMKHYYDFHTAYENLLRGDWQENDKVSIRSQKISLNKWEPQLNQVTYLARDVEDRTVIQLLNFTRDGNMSTVTDYNYMLCWHDNLGERPWPMEYNNESITISGVKDVARVWVATPDNLGGAVQEISFTPATNRITLNLPSLQFWTMIVLEHDNPAGINDISNTSSAPEGTYNLKGQRVSENYKGVVIKNGVKILR